MFKSRYFLDASWPRFFQAMALGWAVLFFGVLWIYVRQFTHLDWDYRNINIGFALFLSFFFALPSVISMSALRYYRQKLTTDLTFLLLSFLFLLLYKVLLDQLFLIGSNGSFSFNHHDLKYDGKRTFAGYVYMLKDAILHFSTMALIAVTYLYIRRKKQLRPLLALALLVCFAGDAVAQPYSKVKKVNRYDPKTIIGIEHVGKILKVPYAFIHKTDERDYKTGEIYKIKPDYFPAYEYLFPSMAPVPLSCTSEMAICAAPPVHGFKAPPKGQDQTVVSLVLKKYYDMTQEVAVRSGRFSPGIMKIRKSNNRYFRDEYLGLEYFKFNQDSLVSYRTLEPQYKNLLIHCNDYWCRIRAAVEKEGWAYSLQFNRHQISKWREIYESRRKFLKMFPPINAK